MSRTLRESSDQLLEGSVIREEHVIRGAAQAPRQAPASPIRACSASWPTPLTPAPMFTDATSLTSKSRRVETSTRDRVACPRTSGGSPYPTITQVISAGNNTSLTADVWRRTGPILKSSQDPPARAFACSRDCSYVASVGAVSACATPAMAASTQFISAFGNIVRHWRQALA
jgi:hypothetical protein